MTLTSKRQAIAAIRKGRASEVLASLLKWRVADPFDKSVCYLYAWALEQAGHSTKAEKVWSTCAGLPSESSSNVDSAPDAIPIKYSYDLAARLLAIWSEEGSDDPIDQMIGRLNAAPGQSEPAVDQKYLDDLVDLSDESTLVSETYGRILVAQKKHAEAAIVYRRLAKEFPEQRDAHLAEAERLSMLTDSSFDS